MEKPGIWVAGCDGIWAAVRPNFAGKSQYVGNCTFEELLLSPGCLYLPDMSRINFSANEGVGYSEAKTFFHLVMDRVSCYQRRPTKPYC
jgi:hypothetical protein